MKVLLTSIAHFRDLHGGCQRIVHDEALELNNRGHEVWVLAPGVACDPEHELRDGVHLLRYVPKKVQPWNPSRRFLHQRAAAALLAKYLPRVDAIHGHTPLTYLAALDLYGASVHTCFTIHSPARLEMAIVWRNAGLPRRLSAPAGLVAITALEQHCLRRSRIVSALSQFTIDCIAKIHGASLAAKVRLLPGWVDTSRYVPIEHRIHAKSRLGWPKDIPVLFTLRRLAPRMGLPRLLEACSMLCRKNVDFRLLIGGSGPMREALETQSTALGLSDVVTFMGRIEDDLLPAFYAACDAFVLPTAELECFGLIALEALATGRPVLATPVGAIPELLTRFEPAWLSHSAHTADIAQLLHEYLAGNIRQHNPWMLHDQVNREYARNTLLPNYLDSTICAC